MAGISFSYNRSEFTKEADNKKAAFKSVISYAIKSVGYSVVQSLKAEMLKTIDRPTDFTLRAFYFDVDDKGTKTPILNVYIQNKQQSYLKHIFDGGTEHNVFTPTDNASLDQYGNPSRFLSATTIAAGGFWMRSHNKHVPTLYERKGNRLVADAMLLPTVTYRKRMDVLATINRSVSDNMQQAFNKAMNKAG